MILPSLAPLAICTTARVAPARQPTPTKNDWATLRFEIERLYVHERRKLRDVMGYMERKYGFTATQQMYKKRFAAWGIHKHPRCPGNSKPTSLAMVSRKAHTPGELGAVPRSPKVGNDDSLVLQLFTSVRMWSVSFYESVQSIDEPTVSRLQRLSPRDSQEINAAFKLVIGLLNRGRASLAGRAARKAFLLVEELLMLEGPALLWNMLEIMHYMVLFGQLQLFQLLLAHLIAMVNGRMPETHPLPAILRALRKILVSLPEWICPLANSSQASSPSSPPLDKNRAAADTGSWLCPGAFSSIINQAWKLNAEILFEHFDTRFFQLYIRIYWDSCSIEPPTAIIAAARKWITQNVPQEISNAAAMVNQTERFIEIMPFQEDRMLQRALATPVNASLPQDYEWLRVSSMATLQHHANSIIGDGARFTGDTTLLLRILAGLITSKVMDEWSKTTDLPNMGVDVTSRISRGQAGNIAGAVRTSMDLNAKDNGARAALDTVGLTRSIVALLEYANAEIDPRSIQEIWLLEDALFAAGDCRKASEVTQMADWRSEQYLQDIPVNSI